MGLNLRSPRGATLIEILIAGLLLSVVFLACAAAYISALKFFTATREKSGQIYAFMAMEHITRRAELANDIIVNDGGVTNAETGKQIKMRWDYDGEGVPNTNTVSDTSDDTWIKYRIIEEPSGSGTWRLFWRKDTAAAGSAADVATTDEQVEAALTLGPGSTFVLTSPSGNTEGQKTVLAVTLESNIGDPPQTLTLNTDVLVGSKAKP